MLTKFALAGRRTALLAIVTTCLGFALAATPAAALSILPPDAPTGLTADNLTSTSVRICWNAVPDAVLYQIRSGLALVGTSTSTCATLTNLAPSTTYSFTVAALDAAGNVSAASSPIVITTLPSTDLVPPTAPANLAWTNADMTVTMTWGASTDNVGVVYYDFFYGAYYIGSTAGTSATLIGFQSGTPYKFTVKARDAAGNLSAASNEITVLLGIQQDTIPPTAPTSLSAANVTSSSFTLSWTASTDNVGVVLYQVFRDGVLAATTFGTTSASLSGLNPNTTYVLTVKAADAANNVSPASAPRSVTTLGGGDTTPPSVPAGLATTDVTDITATLTWTASTDDTAVTGYDVYNGTVLALSVTTNIATVTGLTASTTYSFTVRARDAAGNASAASAALAVSTGPSSTRHQAPYPAVDATSCGGWALVDNVCVPQYCSNLPMSESCAQCGGNTSANCVKVSSKAGMSGEWPEVHSVGTNEDWHFSRSTHFGLTSGGACGFGFYGLCTTKKNFTDAKLAADCDAFCKAYPNLCADPPGTTLRGNFAAPQGNYYTQFWPSLPGDRDNYLSCGECFEVIRTHKDGTDYATGEIGYAPSVTLQILDSCPCSANSKWCCGSGRDHCAEVSDYKYGCPIPPIPAPPPDHDPVPGESIHLDLSDIAMARLQTGDANKEMVDGVIPIRYRRVPCPVVGNVYIWLRSGASPYWFALSVMNVAKMGSVTKVEAQDASGAWIAMHRDANYTSSRPQERYGTWVVPQGSGPFALPLSLRITDPSGKAQVADGVIKAWAPASAAQAETYYIDLGVQF